MRRTRDIALSPTQRSLWVRTNKLKNLLTFNYFYVIILFTMIDLHTHSLLSDGVLLPSELARRAEEKGIKVLAITDHVDTSNMDFVIPRIIQACADLNKVVGIKLIPGCELTHIPPELINELATKARDMGAKIIIAHGETFIEPVAKGTNLAALKSDIDILAHPGLLTKQEAELAKSRNIALEITTRAGHSLSNAHVVKTAQVVGAKLVLNSDAHQIEDLLDVDFARNVARGAGIEDFNLLLANSQEIVEKRI
ncbi:MAG: histidinol phosphate phosphatase domain-containing protein [bacterium]